MEYLGEVQESKGEGKRKRVTKRYSYDVKLRAIKLYLEEGMPGSLLGKELGVKANTFWGWLRAYRERGEAGLRGRVGKPGTRRRLPAPVRAKIVEIKKQEPLFGVKRISHLLKRVFFLSASPEAIRQTLQEESLIAPARKSVPHNISRPRFFERSVPNQMWQADIFTFRLGGRNAYLIGFLDDYSRYVVGLELYRSQTGENVLEVYRRAVSEYGVPKEMLTDNGRQYTNWRGSTRFERELQKDRIRHIKSRPHHPMTLGKMERFWKTIFGEFLVRAQFGSFEEARERVKQWVQYYNHKRPHQGILGLCPADRFFEIQGELRKTIEKGITENILEMALRGKPRSPFYMVGRMEGQSVVLRAEKGKLRLLVDDEQEGKVKEMIYEISPGEEGHSSPERTVSGGEDGKAGERGQTDRREETAEGLGTYGAGEVPGRVSGMDGAAEAGRGLPGSGSDAGRINPVAGAGDEGDVGGLGAAVEADGRRDGLEPAACSIVREEEQNAVHEAGRTAEAVAGGPERGRGDSGGCRGEEGLKITREVPDGGGTGEGVGPGTGFSDSAGAQRRPECPGGSETAWGLPEDLL
jgi:transposase InsO family protein